RSLACHFFFNHTATTEIYTLSLHDALPIWTDAEGAAGQGKSPSVGLIQRNAVLRQGASVKRGNCGGRDTPNRWNATIKPLSEAKDRKSTRLNSSHVEISYAVFCLKKKK